MPLNSGSGGALLNAEKNFGFTGASGLGAVGVTTIFTVTGRVLLERLLMYNSTLLSSGGAATLTLGAVGAATLFVAATDYTALDGGKLWFTTTPGAVSIALPAGFKDIVLLDGANIIITVAVAAVSGGIMKANALWRPLSSDGLLVAA